MMPLNLVIGQHPQGGYYLAIESPRPQYVYKDLSIHTIISDYGVYASPAEAFGVKQRFIESCQDINSRVIKVECTEDDSWLISCPTVSPQRTECHDIDRLVEEFRNTIMEWVKSCGSRS